MMHGVQVLVVVAAITLDHLPSSRHKKKFENLFTFS